MKSCVKSNHNDWRSRAGQDRYAADGMPENGQKKQHLTV
jgi:hypothetical protein